MPKQQKEINLFSNGIVLNADEQDVGDDTATYSLNVSPNTKDGILSGINASKLITSVDDSSTRILFPSSYGEAGVNLNDVTVPKMDNAGLMCVDNITGFANSSNFSYIGTKGYKENLNIAFAIPHMEQLIISQTHFGNTTTNTVGRFEPTVALDANEISIATNDANSTTNLSSYIGPGEYIQFSTSASFIDSSKYEIMKVLTVDTSNHIITVERGALGSMKKTYSTGTIYYVLINRISYNSRYPQIKTEIGYIDGNGFGDKSGNHLKGNSAISRGVSNSPLSWAVSGDATKVVFDADAKSMTISGSIYLDQHVYVGDSITIYTTAYGNSNNHGSTFKIRAIEHTNQVFYFETAPVSETVNSSTTFYFEPSLLKNSTFFHKSASSGVGDAENYKVNDWYMTGRGNSSATMSILYGNRFGLDNDTGAIVQASGNIYTDTNLFGSDLSANYYPYSGKHLTLTSKYKTFPSTYKQTEAVAFNIGDTLLRFEDNAQAVLNNTLFSKGDIIYLDNDSDGSSPTEYMKVLESRTDGLLVERALYGTAEANHSASQYVYKNVGYEINQDIDKNLLKPNTNYELTFWSKLNTGVQATATMVAVSATPSEYNNKEFTLTSSAGTTKTYIFKDSAGTTGTLDGDGKVQIFIPTGASFNTITEIAGGIEAGIEHANGHTTAEISAGNSSGTLTLTQTFHGESGNTEITTGAATDVFTTTEFTGGKSAQGTFALEVNGGYFDSSGNWFPFEQSVSNAGYQAHIAKPSTYYRYNTFDSCIDTRNIPCLENSNIDNLKWRQLSYRFKTPKESIKTDMVVSFGNIGPADSQIALSHVNLSEEVSIYDSSSTAAFNKSSGFIKNKNSKDLVMYDSNNSKLRVIKAFHKDNVLNSIDEVDSSLSGSTDASSSLNDAAFASKNREVHVGFGPDKSDSAPKWLGYLNHKLFGQKLDNLYLDSDSIGSYDDIGTNNFDKICLAGEFERVLASWVQSSLKLTLDMGSGNSHGLTTGDNIIIREYADTANAWDGAGVWFVQDATTSTQTFVCQRNADYDNNPTVNGTNQAFDNGIDGGTARDGTKDSTTGYVSFRPFYYYGIRRGSSHVYRITPEQRMSAVSGVGDTTYPKGKIEKCSAIEFPIESICCSYSKNVSADTMGTDGGHIYVLSSYGDKVARLNVNIAYNEWTKTVPTTTETLLMEYKSFKWSNLRTDGNIGAATEVYDSLAVESTATIELSGKPSDIIETKGPVATFDWDEINNDEALIDPSELDTRLWIQSFPAGENDTFTDGDRFLFCGKTEYQTGNNTVYFADRTPPTVARYGMPARYSVEGDKWAAGPFLKPNEQQASFVGNDELEAGYVGARAIYDTHYTEETSKHKIGNWRPINNFDFSNNLPEATQGENYVCTALNKPFVNWGYNVGWDGNGSNKTAIKVARYGLFQIADNDCDGLLDGTGVVVPNNDSYGDGSAKKYGDLGRRVSSHAVGLIGSSELNWIRRAGQLLGNAADHNFGSNVEYYVHHQGRHLVPGTKTQDHPEYMDASKVVFVCTDMHFGDYPQHSDYTVTLAAGDIDFGGGNANKYTKVTTSESNYLQAGDLVYFGGSGDWGGWEKSFYIVAVSSATTFYVNYSDTRGNDSGSIYLGGFQRNVSGSSDNPYKTYSARGVTRDADNGELPYAFTFNDTDKLDGSVFNQHGGFGRLWYTDQNNSPFNYTGSLTVPAIQNRVEQLNWQAGFMIRPFDMDNEGFEKLLIGEGTSVDMPSFPDTIYHSGTSVKSIGTGTANQVASRLFITSPGTIDETGELEASRIFLCEWNFLYPNESSSIDAESVNSDETTSSRNNPPQWDVAFAGTITSYDAGADSAVENQDSTFHPVIEIDTDNITYNTVAGNNTKNFFAGLYITIVDQTTGYSQTRKIIGHSPEPTGDATLSHLSVHYPFAHTPVPGDKYYVWDGSLIATAPVRLVKEETFRFDESSAYSQDPILAGPMYTSTGAISLTSSSTTATATSTVFHNLTSQDLIVIKESSVSDYDGTYAITVTGPKTFTFTTVGSGLTAATGQWDLAQNSTSSTANPIATSLNTPAIKMSFGDLDMRKLRTIVTNGTDMVDSSGTTTVTSDANLLSAGNVVTLDDDNATTDYEGTFIVASDTTDNFTVLNASATGDSDDGNEYNINTNQWGGVIASSQGESVIGEIRAGLAQWDKGNIDGNSARYDVSDNSRYINTSESSLIITKASIASTTGYFKKNTDYKYKVSLIYDGYQEGPLSSNSWRFRDSSISVDSLDISVAIKDFSKRLTAICVYRKDSEDSFYRLVKQIKTSSGWMDIGDEYTFNFQDDGKSFASYESRTGISEVNSDLSVKYGISCELNSFLFVGNCSHNLIENASNQIFRSKPGKWSIFDWSIDYVVINSTPTAMVGFLGKLIAFDKNTLYKINPQTLAIEDIFEGIGCSGKNSIIVTEYALFFANRQGAYMYDGSMPIKISTPIQAGGKSDMLSLTSSSVAGTSEIDDLSWENTAGNVNSTPPYVTFDSKRNLVYFIVEYINAEDLTYGQSTNVISDYKITRKRSYIWSYSFERKRWDLWELSSNDDIVGKPFLGDDGEVFVSIGNGIFEVQGGADKLLYTWMSKQLIMGTSTVKKVFNKVKVVGPKHKLILDGDHVNDSDKLIVSTDAGRVTSGSNSTTANIVYKSDGTESADYKLKGSNKTAKWIQVRFEEMDEEIKAAAFVYRLRAVK